MTGVSGNGPAMGDYEYFPLKTLTIRGFLDVRKAANALQGWAEGSGYKWHVTSPSREVGSILIEIWSEQIVFSGGETLGGPGLEFFLYWNGDTADDRAIDAAVEQLRTRLAPFGTVEVVSAPPGTPPRKKTTLYGKR